MFRIAILDDYQKLAMTTADWSAVAARAEIVPFHSQIRSVDEAVRVLADFDAVCLMRERMPFPKELIDRLPRLRLIVLTGVRSRTLDVAAASARGVLVSNTGHDPSPHSLPELTWALILGAARRIAACDRGMRRGEWLESVELGTVLHGRTLGVIGLGRIGGRVAEIGRTFGMNVLAWSQNLTAARAAEIGATLVSKEELLSASDVVTLHLVSSERTRGVIGRREFALMKPTAILINSARGPLVDEPALVEALSTRRIAGAALDVYDIEPLPNDHALRRLDNVTLSAHLGYVVEDIYRSYYSGTVEALAAYLDGKPIRLLNPEAPVSRPGG